MKRIVLLGCLMVPGVATAQEAPRAPFTGPYAGLSAGVHEHRFRLEFGDAEIGRTATRTYRDTGIAGGAFAGVDLAVSRRLRVGAEVSGHLGGGDGGRADFGGGRTFELRPRWGLTAVGRAGIVLGDRALVYATLGYGGYRYRLRTAVFVENASDWRDSVAFGGGVEYRLGDRIGMRADVRNLGGQATQFLLGVPIRF